MNIPKIRLKYQGVTGDSLDAINYTVESGDHELQDYVEWLENLLESLPASMVQTYIDIPA